MAYHVSWFTTTVIFAPITWYVLGMSEMSERLKSARIAAGFATAKEASDKFGWNRSTYTAHENGQNDFHIGWATKYGQAFNVSPHVLLFGGTIVSAAPETGDETHPGIDDQLRELPPQASRELIEEFNAMIRGARAVLKKLTSKV